MKAGSVWCYARLRPGPKTLSDALQFPRFSKQGEGGIALAIAKRAFARAKRD